MLTLLQDLRVCGNLTTDCGVYVERDIGGTVKDLRMFYRVALLMGILAVLCGRGDAQGMDHPALRISMTRDTSKAGQRAFLIKLRNAGDHKITLLLGTMTRNDTQWAVQAVHLLLTDASGKTLDLDAGPRGVVGGQFEPFLMPLPPGASFQFAADLDDYASGKARLWRVKQGNVWRLPLAPGRYKLCAEYVVPASRTSALEPVWTGSVRSTQLTFSIAR